MKMKKLIGEKIATTSDLILVTVNQLMSLNIVINYYHGSANPVPRLTHIEEKII